ncbi:MAG: long-chain fatty acid--CoA ligase [Bacillota bacterium]|nr:long-chain fatty acid--CoA ligase [Bacillota bacterium]
MMDHPLLIKTMLNRAYKLFPKKEIFSRCLDKDFRYTYGDFYERVCKLANILDHLRVKPGDKIGTFAWNTHRHMELYFAVTCCGAVLHTINIRLFAGHLQHIVNHAEDKLIFIDDDLVPQIEEIADELTTVEKYIIMTDQESIPETTLSPVFNYERLVGNASPSYDFPDLDENTTAALAYTSATTGLPKGVTYSHRSTYLHALTLCVPDAIGISERDVILPVVPMFHVFSWGFPFSAALMGSKLVLPGRNLSPPALCELIEQEKVTLVPGVPTIWINVFQHLESGAAYDLSSIRYILNGGAAISKTLVEAFHKKYGIKILGTYGMTEASPVVLTCPPKSYMDEWEEEQKYELESKQGRLLPGLEMKVVNENGEEIQWNGNEMGELLLQGPWIASEYYHNPEQSAAVFKDGWYHSNDMVTVDGEGYILVQDRGKDLIKSGGEWISSVDLENKIMAHPAVVEAAVIAIPDQKWQERPMACVVLKESERGRVTEEDILNFLKDKVAKWWLPDKVTFIDEVPKTSVGKFDKKLMREQYA